jgi:serine/threonine protein kinase
VGEKWITRWQADHLLNGESVFHLGGYVLLDHLGTGGMGTVYKGRQGANGPIVAVKLLSQESMEDPITVARFRREIDAASLLKHPCIVQAYHADMADGLFYYVMEFVQGQDLWEWGRRYGQLPIDFSCESMRQACLGLEYARGQGMVHRDLKPANLIVTWPEQGGPPLVKILDMGLARLASDRRAALTKTDQFMGTPDYVAPEQARNAKIADTRSDIFSLGVTLFEMITGQLPFAGGSAMETILIRSMQDAPKLRSMMPSASAELEQVVATMLARDPANRYQTPGESAAALAKFSGPLLNKIVS